MSGWFIYTNIWGHTRSEALTFLDYQVETMNSDGVECSFRGMGGYGYDEATGEYYSPPPPGPCMCARLLMMLHDIAEEECTGGMFLRLQELRGKEVKGRFER